MLVVEPGFTEEDIVWQSDVRESKEHVRTRAQSVLDRIFDEIESTCAYSFRLLYPLALLWG